MKRNLKKYLVLGFMAIFILASCTGAHQPGTRTTVGGLGGAAAGGLIAAGAGGDAATIAGASLLGLLVGGAVGNYLDAQDKEYVAETTQHALESTPTGQSAQWRNPDTGHYGEVTPTRTYTFEDRPPCRDFSQTVYIDGREETVYGTACRQPDGTWRLRQ